MKLALVAVLALAACGAKVSPAPSGEVMTADGSTECVPPSSQGTWVMCAGAWVDCCGDTFPACQAGKGDSCDGRPGLCVCGAAGQELSCMGGRWTQLGPEACP